MDELAPVSKNTVKDEPSSRQSILILCGASILRYRYRLIQLYPGVDCIGKSVTASIPDFFYGSQL